MKKPIVIIGSLILGLSAATIPNIGNVTREIKAPQIEKKKEILPPLQQESEQYKKSFNDGKKVLIKSYLISGNTKIETKKIESIVKPYENKHLSFKELQEVTALITNVYKDQGYFVARAYIPTQNLQAQEGILKIGIIEGEYGKFKLENSSLVKDSVLQAKLDSVKDRQIIATKDLQRALLLINETPGVKVSSTKIAAGKETGTSDFIIGTQATKPYNGYIIGDNYGSVYTGKHRVMVGMDINSPFKVGDKIFLSALSSETTGLLNGKIGYGFPMSSNGLRGEISYTKTSYELGDKYEELNAMGSADSFAALFTYPVIYSSNEYLNSYLKASYNLLSDEYQSIFSKVERNTLVSRVGFDYLKYHSIYSKYSQTKIDFFVTFGRLSFKDPLDRAIDEAGANTNGNFSKINLELENNTMLSNRINWQNRLQLQYALGNKNLDGTEDLSIGGLNGVKLYPDGEENAENGYIYNTEVTYNTSPYYGISSKFGLFYDIARVDMNKNITNEKSRTLQDTGIRYYATYKDFFFNTHFAYKLGTDKVTSQDDYDSRFMFQLGYIYN